MLGKMLDDAADNLRTTKVLSHAMTTEKNIFPLPKCKLQMGSCNSFYRQADAVQTAARLM